MKILATVNEKGCGLAVFCKSAKDLAWLTPLVSAFKAEIQMIWDFSLKNWEDHPQLHAHQETYEIDIVVQFRDVKLEHIESLLKEVHAFIRIVAKYCLIESDDEARPGEDQYIFDPDSRTPPVLFTSLDQMPEYAG
jgi:hypothetical protein